MKKKISTYLLRLPASLKAAVADISKENGTSINQFVTTAEKVSPMKTTEFFAIRSAEADSEAHTVCFDETGASRRNPMIACGDLAVVGGPKLPEAF